VRPVLLIEITSPSTRSIDIRDKRRLYYRAQVPTYVIVDAQGERVNRSLSIIGYHRGTTRYQRLPLSQEGRLWLEAVQLWLGSENGRVACYDAQGQQCLTYEEALQERDIANLAVMQERQRAEQERQRAEQERQRAEQEQKAREATEQRLREAEAEIRRLRGRV
jgi:hypothetical protein